MKVDAGLKEVFRGDLSSVEMAGAMLDELGISSHRRWEQAGGVQFSASETAMIPGREAILLVPSIAYDEAKEALAVNDSSWAAYTIVVAQIHLGDLDGAERSLEAGARKFPAIVLFHSAGALIAALRKDEGAVMRAIERTNQNRKPYGHFHHAEFDVACALATLGRSSEAIDWLTSAVRNGLPCLSAVRDEPLLASLRNESRYRDLVAEVSAQRDSYRDLYERLRPMIWSQ